MTAIDDSSVALGADSDLERLLPDVVRIATEAGARLASRFSPDARVRDAESLRSAIRANEAAVASDLRAELTALRADAGWLEGDLETTALPRGQWWVVDAVEGNVNHVHGLGDWCVTATLVRDGQPVLAVVRQPVGDRTYTAVLGAGASLNGTPLRVSAKQHLETAIAATGQAEAGQTGTYRRIGDSITAMLGSALLVRASVPSTFPLLLVAAGQVDLFWQFAPTLPGIAGGILVATEAGAVVSRVDGAPWRPGSTDVLVSAPAVHRAAVAVLSTVL